MSTDIVVEGYNGGPSALDTAAESFITEISKEYKETALDEQLAAVETPGPSDVPSESAAGAEGAPTEAAPAPAPEAGKVAEDRGFERLVEREVALQAREKAINERDSRYSAMEARLKELETRVIPPDLINRFETDPEAAMKALNLDPENVVRMVIANRLGDKADPAIRGVVESAKIKKELHDLKAALHEQQRAAQAQAFVAKVESEARAYVHKGIGEHAPIVATVAKANPDRVYREIMEEISKDANDKLARGSGGDVLTYDEAAKRVEARWSEFKTLVAPGPAATPDPASTTAPKATAPGAKPTNQTSAPKTPDRPIAPWLSNKDILDEGIAAGLAEFKRVEGGR